MSIISPVRDALPFHWLSGIAEVSGRTSTSVKAWITDEKFIHAEQIQNHKKEVFYIGANTEFARCIAHDIGRMASASFESAFGMMGSKEIPNSSAWTLIRAYYAAYYAANAISRLFGNFVAYLDGEQITALNKVIKFSGNNQNILGGGVYQFIVNSDFSEFTIQKLKNGSHEETWKVFGNLLERLSIDLLTKTEFSSSATVQNASVVLDEIINVLKTQPCGEGFNWLSRMRNEINYQHLYGTWHPHEKSKNFYEGIQQKLSQWRSVPNLSVMDDKYKLVKFSATCACIISICRELVLELVERNSRGNSFLKYGALQVLVKTQL